MTAAAAPAATQTPVETGADMVSTLDKTTSLLAQLQKEIAAVDRLSPRYLLLNRQIQQASVALARHKLDTERQRVVGVTERDLTTAKNVVGHVDKLLVVFQANLAAAKATQQALVDWLASYQAQNNTALAGPIQSQIDTIRGRLDAATQDVANQSDALEKTQHARLIAKAEVSLVEYDQQAQALFDAWLKQRVAVDLASRSKPEAVFDKALFDGRAVSGFEAQVSSCERIAFGKNFSTDNNRYMPALVWHDAYIAAIKLPDLAVLSLNADDLPDWAPELEPAQGAAQAI